MSEFSATLIFTLAVQTKIVVARNKFSLTANAPVFTDFSKNRVFHIDIENYYGIIRKHSRWAIQS
jgi:hypothetical protein